MAVWGGDNSQYNVIGEKNTKSKQNNLQTEKIQRDIYYKLCSRFWFKIHKNINPYYDFSQFFSHPQYNAQTDVNDIALIKLSSPATLNDRVSPVCLAASSEVFNGGERCVTTGWGYTDAASKKIRCSSKM